MLVITQQTAPNNVTQPKKLGGTNKAKKVIGTHEKRAGMEIAFMELGRKAKRADQQRADRRVKRS